MPPKEVPIEVCDDDVGKDDHLGKTELQIVDILKKKVLSDKWIPLKDYKSGEILLSYEFFTIKETANPQPNVEQLSPVRTDLGVKKIEAKQDVKAISNQSKTEVTTVEENIVKIKAREDKVTVHYAINLQKKGMIGKTDPYVILRQGEQKFKLKTINNN